MRGHYKMIRGWMDNPAFTGPFERRSAWVWLIENACWKETKVDIRGKTVTLERGQLSYSYRYLATAWQWSVKEVRTFLARLKADTMIGIEAGTAQTIITICNYSKYQDRRNPKGTAKGTAKGTEGAQKGHKEEGRKESKNNIYGLVEAGFEKFWDAYPSRHPHPHPKKPAREKFEKLIAEGVQATDIIRGAKNFAIYVRQENRDRIFIPLPATWLNQGRWTQYQQPPDRIQYDDGLI